MLKHRSLVECQFCTDQNFNFHMVQRISDRGLKTEYFCSKSCMDLFREAELIPSLGEGNDAEDYLDNEEEIVYISEIITRETDKKVPVKSFKSIGVQTDLPCGCNKENNRLTLVPVKPGKRSAFDYLNSLRLNEGAIVQPIKQQRQ